MGAPESSPERGWLDLARRAAAHVFVDDLLAPKLNIEDRHHLLRVLRLRAGETVSVVDGGGGWRLCTFGDGGALEPQDEVVWPEARGPEVTIGLALTKGDRPEWAVQKLTEVGVDRVIPMVTARSVVRWDPERAGRHVERLRQVARQASMQSRRLRLPTVDALQPVAELLERSWAPAPRPVLAAPGGRPPSLEHPTILIGPEGGWTPEEEAGATAVDLGPSILRTETAAVVAASYLSALRHSLLSPSRQPHHLAASDERTGILEA